MEEKKGEPLFGKVVPLPLVEEIKHSYLDYAMSVIVGRALPDARDGLKPVQRRILYAMMELGLRHNTAYKKSARVVGETMGKYHPHGDSAIYDTMVRMAQDFSMRYPLVDGQGNFGSIDGDPAAAMRYTEARLYEIGELMLADIDQDTVDWGPNFDESLQEPLCLPAMLPNLLINGSSGIAVGMATNIPPHNLVEVVDALCYLIDTEPEQVDIGEILFRMPGPDFPTGGLILGRDGIIDAYRTGRGKITMRGRTHIEEGKRGKTFIVITEIPYMVNKTNLIETIAKNVQDKTIDGVMDLRDESDREGLRIVIEVNRDTDPNLVLRQLYRRTQLQSTFGVINLALIDGYPKELSIEEMLNIFLNHRRSVVRRRTQFRLEKAEARAHIVEGLVKALDIIDEVIALIRGSATTEEAKEGLISKLDFSEAQAQAILEMRLQRLTGLEREKLEAELAQLLSDIERYQTILGNPKVLDSVIKEELLEVKRRFGNERKTEIIDAVEDVSIEDLIPESDIVVVLSRDGYLRRKDLQEYTLQGRGGKGRKGTALQEEDEVALVAVTSTHRDIYLFTSKGRVLALKGYVIPESKTGRGKLINRFVALEEGERVVTMHGRAVDGAKYAFFITLRGTAKRLDLSELENLTRAGRRVMGLDEGDEISQIVLTSGDDHLLIVTAQGQALRTHESEFRPMGRTARGVRGIRLRKNDYVIGCDVVANGRWPLLLSENGFGKRTKYDEFSLRHRGGSGVIVMNLSDRTGLIVGCWSVAEGDEIVAITSRGRMIRLAVSESPVLGRTAMGSIMMRLDEGDTVATASVVSTEDGEDD
ncbi:MULTISPECIES: DNA gyrase subunit A [Aminobacterium]|jgi:DNA gyrase subunit A|uniref:DNA gyrase subunit A n=1 Tax=Aminobacterium colombiense (strain DSM 12261 / ALA-1) TaxID=572547 RepID=GYRA_AMICL|nr:MULTISPECIES: DNA gyrase subunit A [Aminobacterium]D5ECW5.1 RecName: Full=DNA gyrase subunit A [Aminobacterium colombiense DSM 12261]MDD2379198.1 DNA gyrase subunit A [Aminobacterium colombiense]ADE56397.1 DNA gyrase, A subunit [Aminobacterium colombiense DSM 12261]MDD3767910.1 DNA gyrase subunit A [Aminobacterium colombiense]MDD4265431.1 DNA gyrase subunit A [Aminobacterium colombiense]MDD4586128.1 DNA gyrase subunit A [Aminobacterium colombiense]